MQVVYVKTILERIRDAERAAILANREIEKIILTRAEAVQLAKEIGGYVLPAYGRSKLNKVFGVTVEFEGDVTIDTPFLRYSF